MCYGPARGYGDTGPAEPVESAMTSLRSWQTALRRWRVPVVVPAVVTACALPAMAACSTEPARVELPAKPAAATPAALSQPAPATPRQQVIAALAGYTAALGRAEQSGSDIMARQLLRPYVAASRIGGLVKALSSIWAKGERFYGQDVLHVLGVRIDGHRAFVHDCDDTSSMGLENATTGELLPGTAGVQHANLVTRLGQVAGRWLVESQLPEDVPCAP
jgi:hypothetical protein